MRRPSTGSRSSSPTAASSCEGGLTLSAGGGAGGQFGTFDFEKRADRDECKKAVEIAARHFDTVILDDFFFYTSKSDADIAAKGTRSWTQYRLETMRQVSTELVLKPARAINPKIKMIIKYPNWYEHFQGLGYDLEKQAQWFDGIYTGTETRDPYRDRPAAAAVSELRDRALLRQHPPRRRQRRRMGRHLQRPLRRPLRRAAVGHPVRQGPGDHAVQLARHGGAGDDRARRPGRVEEQAHQLQLGRDGQVVQATDGRERGAQLGPRRGLVARADRQVRSTSSAIRSA